MNGFGATGEVAQFIFCHRRRLPPSGQNVNLFGGAHHYRTPQSAVPATPAMVVGATMPLVRKLATVATVAMTLMTRCLDESGAVRRSGRCPFHGATSLHVDDDDRAYLPGEGAGRDKGSVLGSRFGERSLYSVQLPERGHSWREPSWSTRPRLRPHCRPAQSVLPVFLASFVDNALWLMAGLSKGRGLPTELVALNPLTLQRERSVPVNSSLASGSLDSLTGSGRGPLWAAFGEAAPAQPRVRAGAPSGESARGHPVRTCHGQRDEPVPCRSRSHSTSRTATRSDAATSRTQRE